MTYTDTKMNGGVDLDTTIYKLNDGRKLGIKVFEVASLPTITSYGKNQDEASLKIATQFMQLITELHKLCGLNTCVEFIWLTDFFVKDTHI